MKISFDLNYRSKLWSPAEARASWREILPDVNLIVTTQADAELLLDATMDRDGALQAIYNTYRPDAVVITCGGQGSIAYDGSEIVSFPSWKLEPINRLGAGDAFAAGLLYGLINSDLRTGLAYGNAMSALKFTIPQNLPLIDREDVEQLLAGENVRLVR